MTLFVRRLDWDRWLMTGMTLYVVCRLDWDRWLMMGMIGITIGIVGFLLHQALHFIGSIKWQLATQLLRDVSIPWQLASATQLMCDVSINWQLATARA